MVLPLAVGAGLAALPGIAGMFMKNKKSGAERQMEADAAQARDYINLSMNPDDPRYKAMVAQETQGLNQEYLRGLRDLVEVNRRQALMGRAQFFDPERQDESQFSGILQARNDAQNQAGTNVLNRLNTAIGNLRGQQSSNLALAGLQGGRQDDKKQRYLAGLSGLSAGINAFNQPRPKA